ncbi:MAG: ATPase [Saprospiraceae bacterium]|nr:ATPase [Saprospiraceae bacterium]
MLLLVDSGGTRASWAFCRDGQEILRLKTEGLHPLFMSDEQINAILMQVRAQSPQSPEAIFYYGAGCKADAMQERLVQLMSHIFEGARVEVNTDLLGTARALCKRSPGIACILGTGSNTCLYNGSNIVSNIGGWGYVLGDEGSGAAMGKQLLTDYLSGLVPVELKNELETTFQLSHDFIIDSVYRQPKPSRFLASFAPYILSHADHLYFYKLAYDQFVLFLTKYVSIYPQSAQWPVHFTGSVAWYFREILAEAVGVQELTLGNVLVDPMEGLVLFHK